MKYAYLTPRQKLCSLFVGALAIIAAVLTAVILSTSSGGGSNSAGGKAGAAGTKGSSGSGSGSVFDSSGSGSGGHGSGSSGGRPPAVEQLVDDLTADERFRAIRDRIVLLDASDEIDLEDPSSHRGKTAGIPTPQFAAAEWLASRDPMQLHPDDPHLMDRYSLAVFWFATHEAARREDELEAGTGFGNDELDEDEEWANWDRHDDWLSGRGICTWYGIQCLPRESDGPTFGAVLGPEAFEAETHARYDGNGRVTNITLPSNDIRGPLPDELFRVNTDIVHLNLNNNSITGTLPDLFREWRDVEHIFLSHNYLEGYFPQSLASEWHGETLRSLNLGHNWLEGSLPAHLGNLRSLRRLTLYENDFSGTIPSSIGRCTLLEHLMLDSNRFAGPVPDGLYRLTRLTDLRLRENKLQGTIGRDLYKLTQLQILYLDGNDLTGTIPDVFDTMTRLQELALYENDLSGPLPPTIGDLDDLEVLYLDHNHLAGSIPPSWMTGIALRRLRQLLLMDNDLTGTLSRGMVGWEGLVDMRLNGNEFEGSLPEEFGALRSLVHLSLENNRFTGTLSSEFGRLKRLENFKIHLNDLTGTVPEGLCSLVAERGGKLGLFSADCDEGDREDEPPEIECECCTQCFETRAAPPPPNTHSRDRPVMDDFE